VRYAADLAASSKVYFFEGKQVYFITGFKNMQQWRQNTNAATAYLVKIA